MILYLKSSISISAYTGCLIGCKYCILSTCRENNKIWKVIDEDKLIENLSKYKYFVKDFTPITINNTSDPFLNNLLKESAFKLLSLIEERGWTNPIILITKGYLTDKDIENLSKYKLNIYVFYTLSGLSETMENRNLSAQVETIKKLSNCRNLKLIHYWRPVIEGINSDDNTIESVSKLATKYFKASIVSGIRVNSHIKHIFEKENIPLLILPDVEHKVISDETYDKIYNQCKQENPNYPIFRKTSCCISYFENIIDYNGYALSKKMKCIECPNYKVCVSAKMPSKTQINKILNNYKIDAKYSIKNNILYIKTMLSQEDCSALRHNLKIKVVPNELIKSNSEDKLSE